MHHSRPITRQALILAACAWALGSAAGAQERDLDVVLAGGRVMDPETGLDAVRHVGLRADRIAAVSETPLDTRLVPRGARIDVAGLVVAPGFIDLHAHGQSPRANEFQARDGVTTALELEWGAAEVGRWLAMQEVVANAAATGASLHIVHANSMSLGQLPLVLDLIGGAQRRRLDVTTEAYPYTAGSTGIESAIFDDGWRGRLGIDYGDVQWQATRERLTADSFARYRLQGGIVIIHFMKEEMIDLAMRTPS